MERTNEEEGKERQIGKDYSEKYLDQTMEEFYREFDRTVAELGLTEKASVAATQFTYFDCNEKQCKVIWCILSKVYATLRKKGYAIRELYT